MDIAKYIDHTNLKSSATPQDIVQLCQEAIAHKFCAVCVNPINVELASGVLRDLTIKVCTVVGFPLGATWLEIKQAEATRALLKGATELDMVINVGALKQGDWRYVKSEITVLTKLAHAWNATLKVIIETSQLTDKEKATACKLALEAGADFVKTSTGFVGVGAVVSDVMLMRSAVGPNMGVKASGGIKDFATAKAMLDAGASRLGLSASVAVHQEALAYRPPLF